MESKETFIVNFKNIMALELERKTIFTQIQFSTPRFKFSILLDIVIPIT